MSVKPRTIDQLGIESSIRYAKDKAQLDTRLLEESRFIPQKIEVPVIKPYIPSEFDQLFTPGAATLWAAFAPPPDYMAYARPLFSYQLIPSLGGYEKIEADIDRLESLENAADKPQGKKKGRGNEQQDEPEDERQRKLLLALLKCIHSLDRTLNLINSRRNQYQRG
jgi:hypothetical protein